MLATIGILALAAASWQSSLQDDLLDHLVGRWHISRKMAKRSEENTAEIEWVLNHQFVRIHMRDVNVPHKYEAQIYVGYNAEKKEYVMHWIDIFGGSFSETLGIGKRDGNSIEFTFRYPDGMLTNKYSFDASSGVWTSKIDQQDEHGKWGPFCTDTYTKLK